MGDMDERFYNFFPRVSPEILDDDEAQFLLGLKSRLRPLKQEGLEVWERDYHLESFAQYLLMQAYGYEPPGDLKQAARFASDVLAQPSAIM